MTHPSFYQCGYGKRLGLLLILGLSSSQPLAQYEVAKSSINSGGGVATNGSYQLSGSIGQVDASASMVGGGFASATGFWATGQNEEIIFADNFESR